MSKGSLLLCGMMVGLLAMVGCGDDDTPPADAGPGAEDTGPPPPRDAGRDAGPGVDSGPVDMDAGTTASECDPFTPDSCPSGEKCGVVILTVGMDVSVYYGCVSEDAGTRAETLPCSRSEDATPEDSTDDAQTDNCAQGLFCWRPAGTSLASCQRLCGAEGVDCMPDEFCNRLNTEPPFGICTDADNCDPVYQTGCIDGYNCYALSNTQGDRLGTCFEFGETDGGTGAIDEPCMFINTCQGGSQCFPDFYPDGGAGDEFRCRELCDTSGSGPPDGGTGMDGGVGLTGDCTSPEMCADLPLDDGGVDMTPTPIGLCE